MKLYHGGIVEVKTPRIMAPGHIGDFGTGSYTTTDFEQARRFVHTECDREKVLQGTISTFEVPEDFLSMPLWNIRIFREADED